MTWKPIKIGKEFWIKRKSDGYVDGPYGCAEHAAVAAAMEPEGIDTRSLSSMMRYGMTKNQFDNVMTIALGI